MKDGKKLTLDEKGIMMFCIIILSLIFMLGYLVSSKRQSNNETVFSRNELEKIVQLQAVEDEIGSGAEIHAYKDKDGNLVISYDYSNLKKRK